MFFTTEEEKVLARGAFWPYRVTERVVAYGTRMLQVTRICRTRRFVPTQANLAIGGSFCFSAAFIRRKGAIFLSRRSLRSPRHILMSIW